MYPGARARFFARKKRDNAGRFAKDEEKKSCRVVGDCDVSKAKKGFLRVCIAKRRDYA